MAEFLLGKFGDLFEAAKFLDYRSKGRISCYEFTMAFKRLGKDGDKRNSNVLNH